MSDKEIDIELNKEGSEALDCPAQDWSVSETSNVESALFAGQVMTLMDSELSPGQLELNYLGIVAHGFESRELAKQAAPAFARTAFDYLTNMIKD